MRDENACAQANETLSLDDGLRVARAAVTKARDHVQQIEAQIAARDAASADGVLPVYLTRSQIDLLLGLDVVAIPAVGVSFVVGHIQDVVRNQVPSK